MGKNSVKKLYPLIITALSWGVHAAQAPSLPVGASVKTGDTALLVGVWAMTPLSNGIANVTEYLANGTVALHSFNCAKPNVERAVEISRYTLAQDGQSIHIESPQDTFDLEILSLQPTTMRLGMTLSGHPLIFSYQKVQKIVPLCGSYKVDTADEARKSPYKVEDFVPEPTVPPHADLNRYIGAWANEQGHVQIEIRQEKTGTAYLYNANTENWVYLFNDVEWKDDGLHFTAFAYSKKTDLYRHPYHKSKTPQVIAVDKDGALREISFINGTHRFESTLIRKSDKSMVPNTLESSP